LADPGRPVLARKLVKPCERLGTKPQAVVLAHRIASSDNCNLANILRCVLRRLAMLLESMDSPSQPWQPSPAPWVFEQRIYGIPHCLIDRDGRVIGSNLALPNGPLMAEAPVMAELLRNLVVGELTATLRAQAASILRRIDRGRPREPGEDDE
jgi:hypothetical protein